MSIRAIGVVGDAKYQKLVVEASWKWVGSIGFERTPTSSVTPFFNWTLCGRAEVDERRVLIVDEDAVVHYNAQFFRVCGPVLRLSLSIY